MHVGENTMEDVLLDGQSGVNIIVEDLRKKIGLFILKPTSALYSYDGKPNPNQTNRVNLRFENPYPWYFVCHHLHNDEKMY
jgi:hypothetical protein